MSGLCCGPCRSSLLASLVSFFLLTLPSRTLFAFTCLAILLLPLFPLAFGLGSCGRGSCALFLVLLLLALARLLRLLFCTICCSTLLRLAFSCAIVFFHLWLHDPRRQAACTCGLQVPLSRKGRREITAVWNPPQHTTLAQHPHCLLRSYISTTRRHLARLSTVYHPRLQSIRHHPGPGSHTTQRPVDPRLPPAVPHPEEMQGAGE